MTDEQSIVPNDSGVLEFPLVALDLFDRTMPAHQLPGRARRMLFLAAEIYMAAGGPMVEYAPRMGRDMALATVLPGLDADEQAIVASAVAFQRAKLRTHRESSFLRLNDREQTIALRLAAILQVAAGLSEHASHGLRVQSSDALTSIACAVVAPPFDPACVALWHEIIGPLEVLHVLADQVVPGAPAEAWPASTFPRVPEKLHGGENAAEGARRILRRFYERLLAREEDVRKEQHHEDIHQMRVATRRLRASLQVSEAIYDPALVRRFRRKLRDVAHALGGVRDCDVLLQHVLAYRQSLPEAEHPSYETLVAAIHVQREVGLVRLQTYLAARKYRRFKLKFATFLTTPAHGINDVPVTGTPTRVRDLAGSALWRRYEDLRAFEVVLPDAPAPTIHQARIAGKRLRYTLEFFIEALGRNVEEVLAPLMALQEHLGLIQDADTAYERIMALGLSDDPAAQAYLEARAIERAGHLAALPRLWEKVASATYRRRLFELIVKM